MWKTLANHVSDKGLITNIYKNTQNSITIIKPHKNQTEKWAEESNTFFPDIHVANRHMKIYYISNYQGNTNQNHNETSPQAPKNSYY